MVFFFDSVKGINSFLNAKQMLMFDAFFNHHDRREQLCIRDLRGRKFQTPTSIICSKKKTIVFLRFYHCSQFFQMMEYQQCVLRVV